ncbi:MAG: S41 family peptidase [Terriglobales bacterium]
MFRTSLRSAVVLIGALVSCGVLGLLSGQRVRPIPVQEEFRNNLRTFTRVFDVVEQNYADPIDADQAIYRGAIPGMLRALDPHSTFYDPRAFAALNEEQRGKYFGVGIEIGQRAGRVIVIAPISGTPAHRAGLRPGDIIVAIDGKSTDKLNDAEVADAIRGAKGTDVRITVLREGSPTPLDFNIPREEISRSSVDLHFLIRPGIGYVHISTFTHTTEGELRQSLNSFGQLDGLILDLRQNPGGLLIGAVRAAELFLPKGVVIVSQRGRTSPEVVYESRYGNEGKMYPLVVLVNRGTASAAEVVAGALQDHDRGLIAGETTFGKGLVQTVYTLSEKTGLALTTGKYYTPSGRLIQREYTGVSLYGYYTSRPDEEKGTTSDVKKTDSGRRVYGGGGITPDVRIPSSKSNHFQVVLLQRYTVFDFATHYLTERHVSATFFVDEQVLQDFRNFLTGKNIAWSEMELQNNLAWVKTNIKSEIFTNEFGQEEGLRVRAEADPQVLKALELLPVAKNLVERRTESPGIH